MAELISPKMWPVHAERETGCRDAEALHGRAHSSHTVACANSKMVAFDPEKIELKRHELINLIHVQGRRD